MGRVNSVGHIFISRKKYRKPAWGSFIWAPGVVFQGLFYDFSAFPSPKNASKTRGFLSWAASCCRPVGAIRKRSAALIDMQIASYKYGDKYYVKQRASFNFRNWNHIHHKANRAASSTTSAGTLTYITSIELFIMIARQ